MTRPFFPLLSCFNDHCSSCIPTPGLSRIHQNLNGKVVLWKGVIQLTDIWTFKFHMNDRFTPGKRNAILVTYSLPAFQSYKFPRLALSSDHTPVNICLKITFKGIKRFSFFTTPPFFFRLISPLHTS